MHPNWPFADPPNVATFTVRSIVEKRRPILLVAHDDDDDGGWQFLDGDDISMRNSMLVSLSEIAEIDPSILELADLPLGWYARRQSPADSWIRGPKNW
jgi:hypothetical protein